MRIYLHANVLEGRGSRGRGRGEVRGRGRGAAPNSSDATSTAATIASDETPTAWPETTSSEETTFTEVESEYINGVNGIKHESAPVAPTSVWGAPKPQPA